MSRELHLRLEAHFEQMRGRMRDEWAGITDAQLDLIDGRLDRLVGSCVRRQANPPRRSNVS